MVWFIILLIIIVLLLFYPLTLKVELSGNKSSVKGLNVYWLPFAKNNKLQMAIPMRKIKNKKTNKDINRRILGFREKSTIINKIIKNLRIKKLLIDLEFGFKDAALTGIAGGLISATIGTTLAVFSEKVKEFPSYPEYRIRPVFNKSEFSWQANCIVSMNLGDIIKSGFGALRIFLKRGLKKWQEKLK